jgi:hypothetical protein
MRTMLLLVGGGGGLLDWPSPRHLLFASATAIQAVGVYEQDNGDQNVVPGFWLVMLVSRCNGDVSEATPDELGIGIFSPGQPGLRKMHYA